MKELILLAAVIVVLLSGCAFLGELFRPGETDSDGKSKSLGRDLGGAVQMVIEGEWIAGGVAAIAGVVAATGRYFFRRGEKAEKKKIAEIDEAVVKKINGRDPLSPSPASSSPASGTPA